jgi:hypothetical protein
MDKLSIGLGSCYLNAEKLGVPVQGIEITPLEENLQLLNIKRRELLCIAWPA